MMELLRKKNKFEKYLRETSLDEHFKCEYDKEAKIAFYTANTMIKGCSMISQVVIDESYYTIVRYLFSIDKDEKKELQFLRLINNLNDKYNGFKYTLIDGQYISLSIALVSFKEELDPVEIIGFNTTAIDIIDNDIDEFMKIKWS